MSLRSLSWKLSKESKNRHTLYQMDYLAIDLGATSGRTIVGTLADGRVTLSELTRFANPIINLGGHCYWDIFRLYDEITRALRLAHDKGLHLRSIGIDTWGCDITPFGADGAPLRNPLSYRDPHTAKTMERFFSEVMPRKELYGRTGIEMMAFNTIFQLYQMRRDGNAALAAARRLLFTPDALACLLTGKAVCEYTIASTSQLLNPQTRDLDPALLSAVGLDRDQFGPMVMPGTLIGPLSDEVQRFTGLGPVPVIAVAGHDTACAIAAVPARDANFAYLSSGTWSLMGIEAGQPIINDESYQKDFTNEGGVDGTTTFLKNICGMWLYEQCRKEWAAAPEAEASCDHASLLSSAAKAEPFRSVISPDDPAFANPPSMTAAINEACRQSGLPVPRSMGEYCRCIFDSLALRYRDVLEALKRFAGHELSTLHVIGGGSRNALLNQLTADACGVPVVAGPAEGTALGNILLQARAAGEAGDIWHIRSIVAASVETRTFMPRT